MKSLPSLLLMLSLVVVQQCHGVPVDSFFSPGTLISIADDDFDVSGINGPCGVVIDDQHVTLTGTCTLRSTTMDSIMFSPLLVNPADLASAGTQFQLMTADSTDSAVKGNLTNQYNLYYPRGPEFAIQTVTVVTWTLKRSGSAEVDHFQMVAGLNANANQIFVLYLYADNMTEWSSTDSTVSLSVCGNTPWQYENPIADTMLHTSLITNSNVNEPGKYAFFIQDGMIMPAVICRAGCSLENGDCTVKGDCDCSPGWMGLTCDQRECHDVCQENGGCYNEAFMCICNPGWSGGNCTIPDCIPCVNGYCEMPNECICSPDWNGTNCTVPLCNDECEMYGHCEEPFMCICDDANSWSGEDCTTPVCDMCINGDCTMPNMCECQPGWSTNHCNVANCSEACMNSPNGNCNVPNVCACMEGWMGESCEEPICAADCHPDNGYCEAPGECICMEDFIGDNCDQTPAPPLLSTTEIGLLAGGLIVFVIIAAVVVAAIVLSIKLC